MTIKVRTANPMEMPLGTGPCVSVTEDTIMDAEYSLPEDVDKRMFWELFPVTSLFFSLYIPDSR